VYVCICSAITEKMLDDNHFLLPKIGAQCGKCLQGNRISDGNRVTYLAGNESETANNCYDSAAKHSNLKRI